MVDTVTVADGKYTVINDNGKLTALRNGEPWARDLIGDNLVYWMMVEIIRLKEDQELLLEALKRCKFDSLNMTLDDLKFCQAAFKKVTEGDA